MSILSYGLFTMLDFSENVTIKSSAIKSKCGKYRFILSRIWNDSLPVHAFLCANPSKADELRYDTTVFKCGNMAVNWKWGGFYILNLYPNYSVDPAKVFPVSDADELNEKHVVRVIQEVDKVVIACGNGHKRRLDKLLQGVPRSKLYCLRRNKGGGFLHPARVNPEDFRAPILAFPGES